MAISKITTKGIADDSVTSAKLAAGAVTANDIPDTEIPFSKLSQVNLDIAPEVLEIQVAAPAAGQDTAWLWTWEQSTLPYARRTITNSPEVNVPLYKQGTYTLNNYAAYDLFGDMTQTHTLYFKWIDGAGTDNLISWAVSTGPVSDSHPDINGGAATDVQRININVPATITLPTLTAPSVSYSVTNNGSGAYTFSGSAAGDNPNIGPMYRGGTYTFNLNAVGHPFYFTTDNGTNFSAGTYFGEYTTGVTGSRTDNGTVTIVVPSDAPDTLYYQCGNHSSMRGAITIKDLAVEVNNNGNYVVYAMHTQEGHKTPVELRPIPSLVNQMCLVYDAASGKFVPQDLATYVENTPSFENKIREVAGTAELVVEDGSAVIAKVNVYDDSTYLPLVGNNPGDQAFATDTDILYIWDGSAWQQAGAANTDDLAEGSTNLFYTDARVGTYLSANDYDTATNIVASITDSAPATLDTLNELAAALGDDPNFATTITNSIADKLPLTGGTLTGPLEVQGNGNATLEWGDTTAIGALSFDTNDNPLIRSYTGKDLLFQTNGNSNRMVIKSGGNVGIGTNDPQQLLHIHNSSGDFSAEAVITGRLSSGTPKAEVAFKRGTSGDGAMLVLRSSNSSGSLIDAVTIKDGTGNVGIGDDTPQAKLEVRNNTDATDTILASANLVTAGNYHNLLLGDGSAYAVGLRRHITVSNPSYLRPRLDFVVQDTDTYLPSGREVRLSITHNGKVGIGTTNPATKFHVQSEGAGNSNGTFYLGVDTPTNYPAMVLQTSTGGNYSETHGLYIKNTAAGFGLRIDDASGDTSPFVVDTEGRVGIGTTDLQNKLVIQPTASNTDGVRIWRTGVDGDETNLYTNIGGSYNAQIFKMNWKRVNSNSADLRFNVNPTNNTDENSFIIRADNTIALPKRSSDTAGAEGDMYYNTTVGAPRVKTADGWVSFGVALGTQANPVTSVGQAQANSLSTGLHWFQNSSGQTQELYYDSADGGWIMVSSNNANSTTIPSGNNRRDLAYTIRRNGTVGALGTASPDSDYLIGGWVDNFSWTRARLVGFGRGSTNGTYSWSNLGTYIVCQANFSGWATVQTLSNISISGNSSVYTQNSGYWTVDGIQADYNNGGFAANPNQTTIGMVGVAASDGDPDSGCYMGHGNTEGQYEGWYDSGGGAADCQGYTTWVR